MTDLNLEKIIKCEGKNRIIRLCFCIIFVVGIFVRPLYIAVFFLPLVLMSENRGLRLQKRFIKKTDEEIKEDTMSKELYFLHNKLKGRIKRNKILKIPMIFFFLLGFFVFGFSFLGVANSTEPGMAGLFYMMIAFFIFAFGAIVFIIYTILNWTTLELLEDYFDQINKEKSD